MSECGRTPTNPNGYGGMDFTPPKVHPDDRDARIAQLEREIAEAREFNALFADRLADRGTPESLFTFKPPEVDRIVADALHRLKAQVAKAVFDNDYMWDDLAELGINPELEKESNE